MTSPSHRKQAIREQIWTTLETEGVVEPGVTGYIPDFHGADRATERLASLEVWQLATVVMVVPDRAQQPARELALAQGKLVYMAVPRLATERPFYLLDPDTLTAPPQEAADKETAARIAPTVDTDTMHPIDLVICGSVAVNKHGTRLGKGAGYSDIELALLVEAGLLSEHTTIATTIHDLQVTDDDIPTQPHDFPIDLIITPTRVIPCPPAQRPTGLDWNSVSPEQITAIPALAARRQAR